MSISIDRHLPALLVLTALGAVGVGACGGRQGEAGRPKGTCAERAHAAWNKMRAAQDAHRSCKTEADCTQIILASGCFGVCGWPVNKNDGPDALTEVLEELQSETCKVYWEDGCKQIAMPCPPVNDPILCRAGGCEM